MSDDKEPTTAELLGMFHKELLGQGIDKDLADPLTLRAAAELLNQGPLVVRNV